MENRLLFFHKKESWSMNLWRKGVIKNYLFLRNLCCSWKQKGKHAVSNQDCWKLKEMDHPSIQGNQSQLPWIGKQDTSWIDQLSFKGLIHRDKHLHSQSHTVNLELAANLTSMSLDYERNPESHLTTPWGERTQSKGTLKSPRTFFL